MKRILALSLSAALLLTLLCACTGADDPESSVIPSDPTGESASVPPADTTQEPSLALPTEGPSEEVTPEPSEEPSAEPPATDNPTQHPEETHHPEPTHRPEETHHPEPTHRPEETHHPEPTRHPEETHHPEPTQHPEETHHPESTPTPAPANVDLSAVWAQIEVLGDYPSFAPTDDELLAAFYEIDSADLVSYVWKFPLMNTRATEFFIAQVKDGRMDAVRSAVLNRQAMLDNTWALYLPDQYALVKDYKLVVNGNYILFAVSEYADQAVSVFNSFTK